MNQDTAHEIAGQLVAGTNLDRDVDRRALLGAHATAEDALTALVPDPLEWCMWDGGDGKSGATFETEAAWVLVLDVASLYIAALSTGEAGTALRVARYPLDHGVHIVVGEWRAVEPGRNPRNRAWSITLNRSTVTPDYVRYGVGQ